MKLFLNVFFALTPVITFCQTGIVFNGASIHLTNGAILMIDNPAPNALSVKASGGIFSEGPENRVIWNIGNMAASYTVPFISVSNPIPLFFSTSGGTGNGSFTLSTYAGPDWENSQYLPPTVNDVDRDGVDNSLHVIDRFWQINASGYTIQPSLSNLIFSYNDNEWHETGNDIIEGNLSAQNWNSASQNWVSPPVGVDNSSQNQVVVASLNETSYYPWWTLVSSDFDLPLTLLSFTAEKQNDKALLNWLVTAETNVSFYEVQRSTNATNFVAIGKVEAVVNANINNSYSYIDTLAVSHSEIVYYRLRMVDRDGKFGYSPVRYISFADDQNKLVQVSPNPVTNMAIIRFGPVTEGSYEVTIFNAEGKRMMLRHIDVTKNSIFYFPRSADMSGGIYFIKVAGGNLRQTFSILYQ
jgi:hypothetical protein